MTALGVAALGKARQRFGHKAAATSHRAGIAMNFGQAIATGFGKYVTFSGRAYRTEYWLWVLFTVIGGLATGILDKAIFPDVATGSPLNGIFELVTFLPSLAINVRRLHDVNRSGWWLLIVFTIIGVFLLIYWDCKRGTAGPNSYGADPLDSTNSQVGARQPV
jgi:uncharacterized membrane protein YhaH (DUF805 family)